MTEVLSLATEKEEHGGANIAVNILLRDISSLTLKRAVGEVRSQ